MKKNDTAAAQHELIGATAETTEVGHTMHPDAQWFAKKQDSVCFLH